MSSSIDETLYINKVTRIVGNIEKKKLFLTLKIFYDLRLIKHSYTTKNIIFNLRLSHNKTTFVNDYIYTISLINLCSSHTQLTF